MRNRQGNNCIWRKAGFTLVETLLVVGILITLLALSVIAIGNHAADLRQVEMDAKAEQIYIAAQNRLTILRANGVEFKYQLSDDVTPLGYVPCDADMLVVQEKTLSYVTSATKEPEQDKKTAASEILPSGCIDYAVWDNKWIIEYDPMGGTVYAVFYSEQEEEISTDPAYLESMRIKTARRRVTKGHLGYYGGDITVNEEVKELRPLISFDNRETMSVTFVCKAPNTGTAQQVYFDVTIQAADGTGGTFKTSLAATYSGRDTFTATLLLDDLSSEATRFYKICEGVAAGKDLKFHVVATSSNDSVLPGEWTETNNALFAYDTRNGADGRAVIRYARHLQNLDSSSGVHQSITEAVQAQNIDFTEEGQPKDTWYATYVENKGANALEFKPISNENLVSYSGQNLEGNQYAIRNLGLTGTENSSTGLFETLAQGTYQNIYLIGSTVSGAANAGMLAGQVTGDVTLKNCRGYLEREMLVGKDQEDIWVSGKIAGGLVGFIGSDATVDISGCFAATVMEAEANAGGLVGYVASGATVNISGSYADSYITAAAVGGLAVSEGTVTLENVYTAGYLTGSTEAAGLVLGKAAMKNSYAAIRYLGDGGIYTTAVSGSASGKVLYLQAGDGIHVNNTEEYTFVALSNRAAVSNELGQGFVADASQTFAYQLMGQGVSEYSFPALRGLPHYGDWDAEFESGKLVYFEAYEGGSFGFFGANMNALNSTGYAIGDGYGIVYKEPFDPDQARIYYQDDPTGQLVKELERITVEKDETTYHIYKLPEQIVNAQDNDSSFYKKLRVTDEASAEEIYYFNPYFAKTEVTGEAPTEIKGDIIIRTARQLYLLSLYHDQYAESVKGKNFVQELDISYSGDHAYDWNTYWGTAVTQQEPIGRDESQPFLSNYNGYHHKILNLNIVAQSNYVGLFGCVKQTEELPDSGKISNIFLIAENNKGIVGYGKGISEPDETFQIGALVAYNGGVIENCAVAGYSTKLYVYNNSNAFLGGLVGRNDTNGQIVDCSVSSLGTALNINDSSAFVGGFAGVNYGFINRCYTIGTLEVVASKNSMTTAAGFAAGNFQGQIHSSYCATALTASGDMESCAFVPQGGDVNDDCAYLANGAYFLGGELYAFHSQTGNSQGVDYDDREMKDMSIPGFALDAQVMEFYYHSEGTFQYPASVTNGQGQYVHFGEWPQEVNMGESGVFYWEQEYGGNNDGYHLSYLGKDFSIDPDDTDGVVCEGSNLCDSHDDYGNIIRYGYGYYYKKDNKDPQPGAFENLTELPDVAEELQTNMPDYTFVAFASGAEPGQMKPIKEAANMTVSVASVEYTISPFFADAMSVRDQEYEAATNNSEKQATVSTPGTEKNPYMIRSPQQLQFINWNSEKGDTDSFVDAQDVAHTDAFTYLRYFWSTDTTETSEKRYENTPRYHWNQSHDVDFEHDPTAYETQNFAPIGSLVDVGEKNEAVATMAYFAGVYNGQDYTIKNVNIYSGSAGVGLFGVTMGAELRGIALYSDQGNIIQNKDAGVGWYSLGGLVGFAGKGSDDSSVIANCSVAGYTIIDNRDNDGGWGGANIGGLVGSGNMDISKCSAVTDIIIRLGYNDANWNNVRIGGLIGGLRAKISNCYAGGSIVSEVPQIAGGHGETVNLWVGGISGGIVMRSEGNFNGLVGGVDVPVSVENCYSYVKLPTPGYNQIRSTMAIASIGELSTTSFDNYLTSDNQNVVIANCYYLAAMAPSVSDTQPNNGNWQNHYVQYSTYNSKNRYTIFNNSRSPALSYTQMSNGILCDYLGDAFGEVTVTENEAPIHGKYSFPAADKELTGRDYPFPTVLTQVNRFTMDGSEGTVNVHYGAWPKDGLYWDRSEVNLDLFVHKNDSSYETVKITLNNVDNVSIDKNSFTCNNLDDEDADVAEVVRVTGPTEDKNGVKYFEVTLKPLRKGSAELLLNDSLALQVHVTAEVQITATPSPLKLLAAQGQVYEEVSTVLVATNRNGEPLDQTGITWTVHQVHDEIISSIDEDDVGNYADVNTITVPVAGHAAGDTFFTVDLAYLHNGVSYTGFSVLVPISVEEDGVVGLAGIGDKAQVNVPGGDASESQFEIPEGLGASLVLYSDRGLEGFELGQLTVEGQPVEYKLGQKGTAGHMDYVVLVPVLTQNNTDAEVVLNLTRNGQPYTLTLSNVTVSGKLMHTVTFDANNGGETWTQTVEAGTTITLPTPTHPDGTMNFVGWYIDGVEVDMDNPYTVTGDVTLIAEWSSGYNVTFNAFGGKFSDGAGTYEVTVNPGESVTFPSNPTYTQTVRVNGSNRDVTHRFVGWYDENGNRVTSLSNVTEDTVLTAKWTYTVYVVYYNWRGNITTATRTLSDSDSDGVYETNSLQSYGTARNAEVTADGATITVTASGNVISIDESQLFNDEGSLKTIIIDFT